MAKKILKRKKLSGERISKKPVTSKKTSKTVSHVKKPSKATSHTIKKADTSKSKKKPAGKAVKKPVAVKSKISDRKSPKKAKVLKKKPIKIGQTLESNDLYLPHKKDTKSKKRPVIVIDKNSKEEFVIVPGSTEETPNTTKYKKFGIKFYRHNIEIEDDEGNPIKENSKFVKNEKCTVLPESEAKRILNKVLNHTKFSSENKMKYKKFTEKK